MNPAQVEQLGPPRVTALILTRNAAPQLQRCLQALELSQQRDRLEILVVDNGSNDNTTEVLSHFPDVQTLTLPKDFGRTKAHNIGMRTAKGDFLFFLAPHVEVRPDTISRLADRLDAADAVGAVCPYVNRWYRLPDNASLAKACDSGELPNAQATNEQADEIAIEYAPDGPIMVRRLFLRGMNYLDERYGDYWSDLELCWQLRNAGKTILVLPQIAVSYGEASPRENDAVHKADCIGGAAAYVGKHFGTAAGIKFRIASVLKAFGRADFKVLSCLLFGQKIDGTHL